MSRERIGTLDGLRGIAILLVLAGHIAQNLQPLAENTRRWVMAYANAGAGVRLFFVLSGYLITQLLLKEQDDTGTVSLLRFYWRRALRIFPAFYAYLAILALLSCWLPVGLTAQTFTAAATFSWNYAFFWITSPAEGWWNFGHLWTLALEQQFYLLWPAALFLAGRRRALGLAIALLVWCPFARIGTYFLFPDQRGYLSSMLHTAIDPLMAGCAAALLLRETSWRERLRCHGRFGTILAAIWLFVLSPTVGELRHGFPAAGGLTLDALAAAWIIAWAHLESNPITQRILGRGLLPAIGMISYSLYLWQQFFLSPTGPLSRGQIMLPLGGAMLAAVASYHLVERPALRWKSHGPRSALIAG